MAIANLAPAASETQNRMKMSDGFDLFYRRWSSELASESVVICVHGGGRNSEYFGAMGEALSRARIEVYAPDLRGFGNSVEKGLSRGDVSSVARHLQDLADVVDKVRCEHKERKVFMMGHSYGSNYAIWYAANYPEALDGIILMSHGFETTLTPSTSLKVKVISANIFAPKTIIPSHSLWPGSVRDSEEVRFFESNPLDTPGQSARFILRGVVPILNKTLRNAARVTAPVLIVQGGEDPMVRPTGTQKVLDALGSKDKTLKTLPDADHFFYHTLFPKSAFQDDPLKKEQVSATVVEWIRAHRARFDERRPASSLLNPKQ